MGNQTQEKTVIVVYDESTYLYALSVYNWNTCFKYRFKEAVSRIQKSDIKDKRQKLIEELSEAGYSVSFINTEIIGI